MDRRRNDTRTRILDAAEMLVQTRGFNGFSYADIADRVGVTTAALHYHFAGKDRLGEALIDRWTSRHLRALAAIETRHATPAARLSAYVELYANVSRANRLGVCGMLAAEHQTLAPGMRAQVAAFMTANQDWLADVLAAGRADGTLSFEGPTDETALAILAGIQGAALIARPHHDANCFRAATGVLLSSVIREPPPRAGSAG